MKSSVVGKIFVKSFNHDNGSVGSLTSALPIQLRPKLHVVVFVSEIFKTAAEIIEVKTKFIVISNGAYHRIFDKIGIHALVEKHVGDDFWDIALHTLHNAVFKHLRF